MSILKLLVSVDIRLSLVSVDIRELVSVDIRQSLVSVDIRELVSVCGAVDSKNCSAIASFQESV